MNAADAILNGYLAALRSALTVGPVERRRILAEISDGLHCAAEVRMEAGTDPVEAAREAVAEFGDPEEVARGFTAVIAPAFARRSGMLLIATGPLVGLVWLTTTHGAVYHAAPLVLLFVVAAVPAAIRAAVSRSPVAARVATGSCAAADLTLITVMTLHPVTARLLPVAVALSALRALCAGTAWGRLARMAAS